MNTPTKCPSTIQCIQNPCMSQPIPTCSRQCPKFNTCNAPVCPLDASSLKMKHISGDKCCVYLLETAKADAKAHFVGAGLANVYEAIEAVKGEILSSSATIKIAYKRASMTSSRLHPKFIKVKKS